MSLSSFSVSTASSAALGPQALTQRAPDPNVRQTQTSLPSQNTQAVVTTLASSQRTASSGDAKKVDASFESETSPQEAKEKKEKKEGKGKISVVA